MRLLFPLSLAVLIFLVASQNFICENCKCSDRDASSGLKRANPSPLCIHFVKDNNTATATKASFSIKVDDFSATVVNKAQATFVFPYNTTTAATETRIIIQTDDDHMTTALPYVRMTNGAPTFYTNLFNLVIRIKDGKVTELIWDNDCGLCSGFSCLTETLGDNTPTNLCDVKKNCDAQNYNSDCDIKVYVTWVGTDTDGTPMTSAGLRLSQFVKYSISGLYAEASTLVNNAVTTVKNATSSP